MLLQEAAIEIAEQRREAFAAQHIRLGDRQQLQEESRELDDMVVRAPGMAVARADRKARAAIEIRCGVEIAHGMDDVVETAGHGDDQSVEPFRVPGKPREDTSVSGLCQHHLATKKIRDAR